MFDKGGFFKTKIKEIINCKKRLDKVRKNV
nr:MAG TPA: 14-3-3 protein zeta/delta [Caudoviricetes sp.]